MHDMIKALATTIEAQVKRLKRIRDEINKKKPYDYNDNLWRWKRMRDKVHQDTCNRAANDTERFVFDTIRSGNPHHNNEAQMKWFVMTLRFMVYQRTRDLGYGWEHESWCYEPEFWNAIDAQFETLEDYTSAK